MENLDEHFNNVDVVSFDVIHRGCRDNPIENSVQNYNKLRTMISKITPRKKRESVFFCTEK